MMNKNLPARLLGPALVCALFTGNVLAGDALDALDAEVEARAAVIDQQYGVLLTGQERMDLKLSLVAQRINIAATDNSEVVEQKIQQAMQEFAIEDPALQRQLLIKLETQLPALVGTGREPPK